jgi:hypothetical protein
MFNNKSLLLARAKNKPYLYDIVFFQIMIHILKAENAKLFDKPQYVKKTIHQKNRKNIGFFILVL